nr:MAG TPA: hypothetical protein [Caudoviricetes sp.]
MKLLITNHDQTVKRRVLRTLLFLSPDSPLIELKEAFT